MQPLAVSRGQSAQLIVAVQEIADGAQSDGNAAARQLLVDLGDTAMLGVAEASDQGQDIEAELVVRQGQEGFRFRPTGAVVAQAVRVGAAANAQSESGDGVECGDGTVFAVGCPQEMAALRATTNDRRERLGLRGARPAMCPCHGSPSSFSPLLFYAGSPPKFANLEKKRNALFTELERSYRA